ncbi:MAG: hypothetical protein IT176_00420 [Acidobacteria bacterium]|nr:hypothetical protein [Acidobacteriota bacterium]
MANASRPETGRLALRRMPLMAIGLLSMACGAWLGLVRVGWNLPLPWPEALIAHGPLMVCGFLGTLISLERAVALGAPWGYTAPALVAAGALALDLPFMAHFGPPLIAAGSIILIAIFAVLWRRQATLYMATMGLGAVAWTIGNLLWLDGFAIFRLVGWWLAFLVLTIAGERLELNRVLRPTPVVRAIFVCATVLVGAGVAASLRWPEAGVRVLGAGLLLLAAWLFRYDVVRRTVRQRGVTQYMAITLLGGYGWLAIGAVVALATGVTAPGVVYDAMLHAVFLGFVMSMVFAHAPVIFPAVLGRPLLYGPRFYLHVAVLHASLVLRIVGDLDADLGRWRVWGGLWNALALAMFVINVGASIAIAYRADPVRRAPTGDREGRSVRRRIEGRETSA